MQSGRGNSWKASAAISLAVATLAGAGGLGRAAYAADVVKPAPIVAPAAVHPWDLLFGASVVSDYISRGYRQSTGAAIQPWAELDWGPVYFGYWGSNTSPSLIGSSWENDLSVGVRGMHGPVNWDFGYLRYVYDTGDCCGELYAKGSINPTTPVTLGVQVFYNPDSSESASQVYVEGDAKLAIHDMWSISGAVGNQSYYGGGNDFSWNAGLSYAPTDWLTFDGRYYAGPDADKFVVSVAFATALSKVKMGQY